MLGRRALVPDFAAVHDSGLSASQNKVLFPGGAHFMMTDAGNHFGMTTLDGGNAQPEQVRYSRHLHLFMIHHPPLTLTPLLFVLHQYGNPRAYFNDFSTGSGLTLLHFSLPSSFAEWKEKVIQRAIAIGFGHDLEDPNSRKLANQCNAHYRVMYHAIQAGHEAAHESYRSFCDFSVTPSEVQRKVERVVVSLAERLLFCNPFFPEADATDCAAL